MREGGGVQFRFSFHHSALVRLQMIYPYFPVNPSYVLDEANSALLFCNLHYNP